jgi:hypothetical protein
MTTPPNNVPADGKDDNIEGRSGDLAATCQLTWNTPPGMTPAEPNINFSSCLTSAFPDLAMPTNNHWTYYSQHDGPVPHLCLCENSPDVQYSLVEVDSGDYIGKLRKFSASSAPQGGGVTVYLNGVSATFSTTVTPPASIHRVLNERMREALEQLSEEVSETTRYFVIESQGPSRQPLLRVGMQSNDPGLIRSEVALDPPEMGHGVDVLACVEDVSPPNTKCGAY